MGLGLDSWSRWEGLCGRGLGGRDLGEPRESGGARIGQLAAVGGTSGVGRGSGLDNAVLKAGLLQAKSQTYEAWPREWDWAANKLSLKL